jgi:hypothetical protein
MTEATEAKPTSKGTIRHRPPQASAYLLEHYGIRHTEPTLASKRTNGDGPAFQKAGPAVLYTEAALDEYAERYLGPPVTSTAALPPHRRRRAAGAAGAFTLVSSTNATP